MKNYSGPIVYTVYNKPPFVNEILNAIKPDSLSITDFRKLIEESSKYDINTMLTAMTREVDISGLVPNLAGSCGDAEEVLKFLTEIGHKHLLTIKSLERDIRIEVLETLTGSDFSLRAMLILDEIQRDVIGQLLPIRQKWPMATAVRQASEASLRELYKTPIKIHSDVFDKAILLNEREVLKRGEPRICYPSVVVDGGVLEVWQYFQLPRLENIILPGHFNKFSMRQVLENITPKFYIKDSSYDDRYDPESPVGFMGLLGNVGNALPRMFVTQIKKNSRLNEMIQKDNVISRSLYELFTTYPRPN